MAINNRYKLLLHWYIYTCKDYYKYINMLLTRIKYCLILLYIGRQKKRSHIGIALFYFKLSFISLISARSLIRSIYNRINWILNNSAFFVTSCSSYSVIYIEPSTFLYLYTISMRLFLIRIKDILLQRTGILCSRINW